MSDAESGYEGGRHAVVPKPCGCELLSGCCGAPPHMATPDVSKDNLVGICGQCRDHCSFEPSQEQTWVQIRFSRHGDVVLRVFQCTNCKDEEEMFYAQSVRDTQTSRKRLG